MNELHHSWQRAWAGIGARTDGQGVHAQLLARYSEPHRHYHTLQHLGECLAMFESVDRLAERPAEVELALWFHDAIYDTQRSDNEACSAEWARAALNEAGVARDSADRVQALIMATRHTASPTLPDEQLLVDIDLSILAAEQPRFGEYEAQIRKEYAFVPRWLFRRKRKAILQGFLDRPAIYSTPHFRQMLEQRARENLKQAIAIS
jgi:predicted metal-dependent HD superfamily phosphohydrolase